MSRSFKKSSSGDTIGDEMMTGREEEHVSSSMWSLFLKSEFHGTWRLCSISIGISSAAHISTRAKMKIPRQKGADFSSKPELHMATD